MPTPSERRASGLRISRLGCVPYGEALALQERIRAERIAGRIGDRVLLLEHPDVITFGTSSGAGHAPPEAELRQAGYDVYRVNRGGDVTWHGPGQLVGYPILDLAERGGDVHVYLRTLAGALIESLAELGIEARRREGYTGVWLDERRKIASIGVGIRRWVTLHGFALNVTCDLSRFAPITACGLHGIEMTSVERALAPDSVSFKEVEDRVEAALSRAFG